MIRRVRAFVAFVYDFVVGDDWLTAAAVVIALTGTYLMSRTAAPAWWIVPATVGVFVPLNLWRATRRR